LDAGTFVRRPGAYVLMHATDGDTTVQLLPPRALTCVPEHEDAYLRIVLERQENAVSRIRVVEHEGAPASVDCLLARVQAKPPWSKDYEPASVEVVVVGK